MSLALWVLGAGSTRAELATIDVFLDLDRDASTGCDVTTPEGLAAGVESRVRTQFDVGTEEVLSTTHAECADPILGAFGIESLVTTPPTSPLSGTLGNGTAGSMLVESHVPAAVTAPAGTARTFVVVESPVGADALLAEGMGAPLILPLFAPLVPALGAFGLATTVLLLLVVGATGIRTARLDDRRAIGVGLALCFVLGSMSNPATVRALLGEGSQRVWSLEERIALDPEGDAPLGIDLLAFYAYADPVSRELWLRVDVLFGAPVCLDWGQVDPGTGYSCKQEPPLDPGPFAGPVALTFDDGPNLATTPGVLALLRAGSIPATFFVVGDRVVTPAEQALVAEIHQDPLFRIANHSLDHSRLPELSPPEIEDQVVETSDRIREAIGDPCYFPRFFRFPYGDSDCVSMEIVRSHGFGVVGVNMDPKDWCYGLGDGTCPASLSPSLPEVFRDDLPGYAVYKYLQAGGGIMLLHDLHPNTLNELPAILAGLESAGASFVALEDLGLFPALNAAVMSPEPPACCEGVVH